MRIEIPDEIARELRLPPEQAEMWIKRELAIHLVRGHICTLAQGAALAEMPRLLFERLLGESRVPWAGTIHEVKQDLETLDAR